MIVTSCNISGIIYGMSGNVGNGVIVLVYHLRYQEKKIERNWLSFDRFRTENVILEFFVPKTYFAELHLLRKIEGG